MSYTRILACKKVRTASTLAHNSKCKINWGCKRSIRETTPEWYSFKIFRREATLWNMVACLAKGNDPQALHHAPVAVRSEYMRIAKARWKELQEWVARNPATAKSLCEPLIREYAERAERRRKSVVA